jgi:hypothetical protein
VTRTSGGAAYKGFSPYLNYLLRPQSQEFDDVSWYCYLKDFEVVRRRPHKSTETIAGDEAVEQRSRPKPCDTSFLLSPSHPQYGSKAVTARANPVVVRIVGPGIRPSVRRDSNEKENEFSKQVLLLFLPHRTVGELKGNKTSWIESLNDAYASNHICDAGLRFLRNHEDRWESILRSQDLAASFKESLREIDAKVSLEEDSNCRAVSTEANAQTGNASDGEYLSSEEEEDEVVGDELRDETTPDDLLEEEQTPSSNMDLLLFVDEFHMPEEFITNKLKNPEMTKKLMASTIPTLVTAYKATPKTEIPYFAHCNTLEDGLKPQVMLEDEDSDEEQQSCCDAGDNMVQQENQAPRLMEVKEVLSFQELVECAVVWPQTPRSKFLFETKRDAWVTTMITAHGTSDAKKSTTCFVTIEIDQPQKEIPLFASIAEISNVCSLLEDQHRAFFIIGSALLRSFALDEMDNIGGEKDFPFPCCSSSYPTDLEEQQALLLIHGVGGSGKSVIVRAITALAMSWMRTRAIITASIAGVACVNISGYTIASLMYKKRSFFDQVGVSSSCYSQFLLLLHQYFT